VNVNLTLVVDEDVLERARDVASQQGTTDNALIRDFLDQLAEEAARRLAGMAMESRRPLRRPDRSLAMSPRVFLDTNILLYPEDASAGRKRARAVEVITELVAASSAVVSTQVLQEYYVAATSKLGLAPEVARENVGRLAQLDVVQVRPELVLGAIDVHRLNRISFWNALIVRSASAGGCGVLLTEDLSHGQVIDGVRVVNPFRADAGRAGERRARWRRASPRVGASRHTP
jgi:predicted nucleic acid-binding protein